MVGFSGNLWRVGGESVEEGLDALGSGHGS